MADAYGSGPYESNFMQVQVLLSAPAESLGAHVAFEAFIFTNLNIDVLSSILNLSSDDVFKIKNYSKMFLKNLKIVKNFKKSLKNHIN